jgi:hypothetical protein
MCWRTAARPASTRWSGSRSWRRERLRASSSRAPAPRPVRAGAAGTAEAARFTRINLLDARLAGAGAARRDVLPQRDDLFRQADAVRDPEAFVPLLREDGLLFAGHSESFLHAADLFHSLGRTVYERADRAAHGRRARL